MCVFAAYNKHADVHIYSICYIFWQVILMLSSLQHNSMSATCRELPVDVFQLQPSAEFAQAACPMSQVFQIAVVLHVGQAHACPMGSIKPLKVCELLLQ